MTVLDSYLPIDFIPLTQAIVQDNKIYCMGSFFSQNSDSNQVMWMDGAFVLEINAHGAKIIEYLESKGQ